jgi:multiple sugar transport system substrate-binding protein
MNCRFSRRDFLRLGATTGLGLIAAGLAGCGTTATPSPAPTTEVSTETEPEGAAFLNYWTGWSGFEFDALQELVDKFNESQSDIYVNMTTVFGQYDKVLTAIAGGNPPDVVSAVWLHQFSSMATRGGLMALDEYASRDGIDGSEYFESCWDAWHIDSKLYGLAVTVNANILGYRRDIFEEIGLDPDDPPTTIDELDAAAQALEILADNGDIERYGLMPSGLYWWGNVFGGTF